MNPTMPNSTVTVPVELLERLLEHSESLLEASDELEDFFIAHNPDMLAKLRQARQEHLAGNLISFEDLKARYV